MLVFASFEFSDSLLEISSEESLAFNAGRFSIIDLLSASDSSVKGVTLSDFFKASVRVTGTFGKADFIFSDSLG